MRRGITIAITPTNTGSPGTITSGSFSYSGRTTRTVVSAIGEFTAEIQRLKSQLEEAQLIIETLIWESYSSNANTASYGMRMRRGSRTIAASHAWCCHRPNKNTTTEDLRKGSSTNTDPTPA